MRIFVILLVLLISFQAHAEPTTFACGGSNDDAVVQAAWSYAKTSGENFKWPNGTCKLVSQEAFDLNGMPLGMTMTGYGPNNSKVISTTTSSPAIKFYTSGGSAPPGAHSNTDNFIREHFSIQCSLNGVCVQDGDDNYDDSGSSWYVHDVISSNNGTGSSTVSWKTNYQVHALYDFETAAAGSGASTNGDCIQSTYSQFNTFFVTAGGCTNAFHFTGANNIGNSLLTPDFEVVYNAVLVDGTNQRNNTFYGGYWNYMNHAIINNASGSSVSNIYNPADTPYGGAGSFISGSNTAGIIVDNGTGGSGIPSVFTRTGAITAQSGDYAVAQVTGAAPLASPTFTGTVTLPASQVVNGVTLQTGGLSTLYLSKAGTYSTPPGGGGSTTWPAASIGYSSTQVVAGTGTWTTANFNSVAYDNQSAYNTSTHIYTIPTTGLYAVDAACRVPMTNGANQSIRIAVNGSGYNVDRNWSTTGNLGQLHIHDEISLSSGDTVAIQLYQDTGSNKTFDLESFTIHQFSN